MVLQYYLFRESGQERKLEKRSVLFEIILAKFQSLSNQRIIQDQIEKNHERRPSKQAQGTLMKILTFALFVIQ
ncbi:hypothetical protein A0J61_07925 [Choanephora cucurbitarum]|uniref:Uncharacterized protein n=1 Tax=Choanephora cucurbitarum TaxID=101091 RepID=A0A1C7N4I1_9FUNG|nr:hypothetical protein A0J61_07925 [Choanephora cucurbitarum]